MAIRKLFPFPLPPLLLLVGIFYLNFISRVILAPLLPVIEKDLGLGHGEAGSLFFYIAAGYASGLWLSGFISAYLNHRNTLILSTFLVGVMMIAVSASSSLGAIRFYLFLCGVMAGLYLPSALASLTDWVSKEHLGKAMSIHELAPNLGFITAPLLAEILLKILNWQGALTFVGAGAIVMGLLYLWWGGRRGTIKGTPPRLQSMYLIIKNPSFWVMAAFFLISIGSSLGSYTMMPLFLVTEIGMERGWANTLIGLSRVFGTIILFFSGIIIDSLGAKRGMTLFLSFTGFFMLFLGLIPGPFLTPFFLFLQTASAACLFPVGFTILSLIFSEELRSVGVSMVILVGFILGGGVVPSLLGHWAEAFSFSSGFTLLGAIFILVIPFFQYFAKHMHFPD